MSPSGKKVLITGPPGCGKTTLIKDLYSSLPQFEGFWTEEVRERGIRTGFQIVTTWGERLCLSSKKSSSLFRVGKYGVEMENLSHVCKRLRKLHEEGERWFLIDEIGKMEYLSADFRRTLWGIFEDPNTSIIATIAERDFHPDIKKLKERADLHRLSRENFQELRGIILPLFRTGD